MAEIVEIAECFEGRDHESHKYNLMNLRKQQVARVANGWKSQFKQGIENNPLQCWSEVVEHGKPASSSEDNW